MTALQSLWRYCLRPSCPPVLRDLRHSHIVACEKWVVKRSTGRLCSAACVCCTLSLSGPCVCSYPLCGAYNRQGRGETFPDNRRSPICQSCAGPAEADLSSECHPVYRNNGSTACSQGRSWVCLGRQERSQEGEVRSRAAGRPAFCLCTAERGMRGQGVCWFPRSVLAWAKAGSANRREHGLLPAASLFPFRAHGLLFDRGLFYPSGVLFPACAEEYFHPHTPADRRLVLLFPGAGSEPASSSMSAESGAFSLCFACSVALLTAGP